MDALNKDALTKGQQNDFITLESISMLEVSDKVKSINDHEMMNIEVALHTPENTSSVIDTFESFALQNGAIVDTARSIKVKGLTFMPIKASKDVALKLAEFSFLRTLQRAS